MIHVRTSTDRGHGDHGWLDSRHTFSFADYHDERFMGFRSLRVINEDRVEGGAGFPTHSHRDMEIVSYVLEGALEHKDSMGTGSVLRPGSVQKMSAGTGVRHSEFNGSAKDPLHFLQIWIQPDKRGVKPDYQEVQLPEEARRDKLLLVAGPVGAGAPVSLHSDAKIYASLLGKGASVEVKTSADRGIWVQVTRGAVEVNGHALKAGDGAALTEETAVTIRGVDPAELLVFDLA